jgi:hypothetical protein
MGRELALFVPLVGLVRFARAGLPSRASVAPWLYGGWLLVAAGISLASLNSF